MKIGIHCICHGTVLFRGYVFDELGGYTRKFDKAIDAEWLSRCVLKGIRAYIIIEDMPSKCLSSRRYLLSIRDVKAT